MGTFSGALLADGADRRAAYRPVYNRTAIIRRSDDIAREVGIGDLTRDGCRLKTDEVLEPGENIKVGIGGIGLRSAQVVWRGTEGYGCRFDHPLAPGSITAAFLPSNVSTLSYAPTQTVAAHRKKLTARGSLVAIVAITSASWCLIASMVLFFPTRSIY